MNKKSEIFIAGSAGMVGGAIVKKLLEKGYSNIIGTYLGNKPDDNCINYFQLNLLDQKAVKEFFETQQPEYVFQAAAKVGGIQANNVYRAQFIYENLQIQNNIIHQSYLSKVKKLLFLGSSCIYPKLCPQPIKEEYLLTGELEDTNEPYAIAKIAGIKMCESYRDQYGCNFISVMPTNLYGPGDNFDLEKSHVLPALIRKFHEAKLNKAEYVEIWGTGSPRREFLHVTDLADAVVYLMENYDGKQFLNIGCGDDISIKDLALLIKKITGFEGELKFDTSKPDGTPRKLLDVSKLKSTGFEPKISLEDGIRSVYKMFSENYDKLTNK